MIRATMLHSQCCLLKSDLHHMQSILAKPLAKLLACIAIATPECTCQWSGVPLGVVLAASCVKPHAPCGHGLSYRNPVPRSSALVLPCPVTEPTWLPSVTLTATRMQMCFAVLPESCRSWMLCPLMKQLDGCFGLKRNCAGQTFSHHAGPHRHQTCKMWRACSGQQRFLPFLGGEGREMKKI